VRSAGAISYWNWRVTCALRPLVRAGPRRDSPHFRKPPFEPTSEASQKKACHDRFPMKSVPDAQLLRIDLCALSCNPAWPRQPLPPAIRQQSGVCSHLRRRLAGSKLCPPFSQAFGSATCGGVWRLTRPKNQDFCGLWRYCGWRGVGGICPAVERDGEIGRGMS
jgi:hypothetical protein